MNTNFTQISNRQEKVPARKKLWKLFYHDTLFWDLLGAAGAILLNESSTIEHGEHLHTFKKITEIASFLG